MEGFATDDEARATLAYCAQWTAECTVDPIAIPGGASVEIVAVLFGALLAECRPERYVTCSTQTRREAADLGRRLLYAYERYLRARVDHVRPEELDVEAALTLARMMMTQRRLTEAAQIYGQLATTLRWSGDTLALAHAEDRAARSR